MARWSAEQLRNAQIIISVGREMGMSNRDIQIGLMTAMQESALRTGSAVYKKDHDSIGLFQQRPYASGRTWGWGTEAQLDDPRYASRAFFNALSKVKNRNGMSLTRAAQTVQRSAFPNAYAKHEAAAASLLSGGRASRTGRRVPPSERGFSMGGDTGSVTGGGVRGGNVGGGGSSTDNGAGVGDNQIGGGFSGLNYEDTWSQDDFEAALAASGFGSYLVKSNPELKSLFGKAIQERWTPDRFAGEIKSTKWYRTHDASSRQYTADRYNDPATFARKTHEYQQEVIRMAGALGVKLSKSRLDTLAKTAYRFGMGTESGGELHRMIAAEFDYQPGKSYSSAAGATLNNVKALAASYGINLRDKDLAGTTEAILKGDQTIDGLRNAYINNAKKRYSQFTKELDAGMSLDEISQPYKDLAAKVYEINPNDITINDKFIQQGLAWKSSKTGDVSAMPMWQYEEALKSDPRWLKTNNAQDSLMSVGHQLLASFGLVGS